MMNTVQKKLFNKLTAFQQRVATHLIAGSEPVDAYYAAGGKSATRKGAIDKVSKMRKLHNFSGFMDLMAVDVISEAVMTRTKALEKLSDIAMNSKSDQAAISAISKLCDLQGWNAPSKTMEVIAPLGISERYSQEDYEAAEKWVNERYGHHHSASTH